jgi:flavin-dependent dehydrogenase
VWGSAIPHVADALQDPFGAAWHLDRGRFDRMLRLAAQSAGAFVLKDTRVVSAQRTAHNVWTVATKTREQITVRQATVVVDARGRQARVLLGCRVTASSDRLVATAFVFSSPLKDPHCEWTLVEACADGWWYSAPLPNARSSVVFFTDADLHAHRNDVRQLAHGTGASLTIDRIPRTQQPMAVVRMPAWSDNRHPSEPATCVRVGDAAVAYDPLSGAGLCRHWKPRLTRPRRLQRTTGATSTRWPSMALGSMKPFHRISHLERDFTRSSSDGLRRHSGGVATPNERSVC